MQSYWFAKQTHCFFDVSVTVAVVVAVVITKAWFPYDRSITATRHWEKNVQRSQRSQRQRSLRWNFFYLNDRCRIAAIAGKWFPYDRYDRWTFFFSAIAAIAAIAAITAIVTIIWKPGLKLPKGDVTRDDSQRRFLAWHRVTTLKQCCNHSK